MGKCLAFCQTLVTSKQKFTFSLCIGKDTFTFDNKELESRSCSQKKKSPSQLRREARRKEEHKLKHASKTTEKVVSHNSDTTDKHDALAEAEQVSEKETAASLEINCNECDFKSATEKGLRIHSRMNHRISQLDGSADDLLVDTETENITEKVSKEEDTVKKKGTISMKEITDKLVVLEVEKIGLNQLAQEKGYKDI